jgi:hypothetical protein
MQVASVRRVMKSFDRIARSIDEVFNVSENSKSLTELIQR